MDNRMIRSIEEDIGYINHCAKEISSGNNNFCYKNIEERYHKVIGKLKMLDIFIEELREQI